MRSLPFLCLRRIKERASASCFPLRAIQATAAKSGLHGEGRSEVYKYLSIARRARSGLSDAKYLHLWVVHRPGQFRWNRGEIGRAFRPPAIRMMLRNSDSRILVGDLGALPPSVCSKTMLPRDAALRVTDLSSGYAERDPVFSPLCNFAISFSSQPAAASSISSCVPPRYKWSNVSPRGVNGMWRHGTFSPRLSEGTNSISKHSAHGARFSLLS